MYYKNKIICGIFFMLIATLSSASSLKSATYVLVKNDTSYGPVSAQLCEYWVQCPDFSANLGANGGTMIISAPIYKTYPAWFSWNDGNSSNATDCTNQNLSSATNHKVTLFYSQLAEQVQCCVDGLVNQDKKFPCKN